MIALASVCLGLIINLNAKVAIVRVYKWNSYLIIFWLTVIIIIIIMLTNYQLSELKEYYSAI